MVGSDKAFVGGCALLRAHAALQNNGVVSSVCECLCEVGDVSGALRENEAVSASPEGLHDVTENLLIPCLVLRQGSVDACDGARDGEIDWLRQLE